MIILLLIQANVLELLDNLDHDQPVSEKPADYGLHYLSFYDLHVSPRLLQILR